MGNCSVVKPARDFVLFCLFFLFFSVKCHIQQLEKAVSILNIKKMKNATNILFSLTTLPEKK